MQKAFVTGAARFIGSSLCDRLLREDVEVVGWDNFSTGQHDFVETAQQNDLHRRSQRPQKGFIRWRVNLQFSQDSS
jgi:nucleoside-diphosphate-sugar epimerase